LFVADHRSQTAFPDRNSERFQFVPTAFRDEFDPAIQQVPNRSSDFEAGCQISGLVPETHPLDTSGVPDVHSEAVHHRQRRNYGRTGFLRLSKGKSLSTPSGGGANSYFQ
jgi:hypothetical protein